MTNNSLHRIHIISLGCSKNLIDSEVMGGLLQKAGMRIVEHAADADVVIVNTCGFIGPAKEEALEVILTLAEDKKRRGQNMKLVVAGCLAQRYGKELLRELPEVDLFIGTGEVGRVVGHLQTITTPKPRRTAVITKPDFLMTSQHERMLSSVSSTAFLKISDGCSNRCTYCAIPLIRGRARSRRPDDILREAESLVRRGIREIILIGQDTTAYGADLKNRPKLSSLLSELAMLSGLRWLRLLYAHPAHITTDVLVAMASHPGICRYIDLPVQHIDDTILAAMNRKVTADSIQEIIGRSAQPDAGHCPSNIHHCGISGRNAETI